MTAIVVLGMHRSGTSLIANMLQAMGIHMGDDLLPPGESNQRGHWEDRDFLQLNESLLLDAGGSWRNPPGIDDLRAARYRMQPALRALLSHKQAEDRLWGWKDPRNSLTAMLWHKYLDDPRYVVVKRDKADVIDSLKMRDGIEDWGWLYDTYQSRIDLFLKGIEAPILHLRYEDLTHPGAAPMAAQKLAAFVGLDTFAAARALECIEYRDSWGFGSIGIGVPYYRAEYEFFRWWSWLLVGGLEDGDQLLNNPDLRCEVPIPLAHNGIVQEFLKTTRDTLCIAEDDHAAEQDIIHRMRYKPENQEFDIVCASYVNRRGATVAVGCDFNWDTSPTDYGEIDCKREPLRTAKEGTQQYDCAALGLVLIRRWILEAMLADEDPEEYFWFDWRGRNSQDVQFYYRTRPFGARIGVDRDNHIGHIGKKIWTMGDFHRVWDNPKLREAMKDGRV